MAIQMFIMSSINMQRMLIRINERVKKLRKQLDKIDVEFGGVRTAGVDMEVESFHVKEYKFYPVAKLECLK